MHNSLETKQLPSLLTVNIFSEKHPTFTKSILRSSLSYFTKNGFYRCIVRIRRQILINEVEVFESIDAQNEEKT